MNSVKCPECGKSNYVTCSTCSECGSSLVNASEASTNSSKGKNAIASILLGMLTFLFVALFSGVILVFVVFLLTPLTLTALHIHPEGYYGILYLYLSFALLASLVIGVSAAAFAVKKDIVSRSDVTKS